MWVRRAEEEVLVISVERQAMGFGRGHRLGLRGGVGRWLIWG
jgi:hypothetical protein